MADSNQGPNNPQRMAHPFPSRREIHGNRIPQRPTPEPSAPDTAPQETSAQVEAKPPTAPPFPKRQPPRRPRTAVPAAEPEVEAVAPTYEPLEEFSVEVDADAAVPAGETVSPATQGQIRSFDEAVFADPAPVAAADQPAPAAPADIPVPATARKTEAPFPKRVSPITASQPVLTLPAEPEAEARVAAVQKNGEARRKRIRRRRIWTALIIFIVLALAAGAGWWAFRSLQGQPILIEADDYPAVDWTNASEADHPLVEVTIDPGDPGWQMADKLVEADVVKTTTAFNRAFDANPAANSIQPGTYTLPQRIPAADALARLLDETNRSENTISVNPGQTVDQISEKMVAIAGFDAAEVAALVADPSPVTNLPSVAGGNLEGWLWAGAYDFSPDDTAASIFEAMVQPTVDYLTDAGVPEDEWETVLTKASIVEREVNRVEDMPKVARVIENRLADPAGPTQGMLQMDSTVAYGVGQIGGLPDGAAFEDDNPYNTYILKGLPAGPIASPSEEAIEAVLAPEEGTWLYFVTVNLSTGETLFTDNYDELQELTELLNQWCQENPGECDR